MPCTYFFTTFVFERRKTDPICLAAQFFLNLTTKPKLKTGRMKSNC